MDLNIRGRKAVITGGSKGIGRAVADRLASEGVDVHLVARTPATLETAVSELRNDYGITASFSAHWTYRSARTLIDCLPTAAIQLIFSSITLEPSRAAAWIWWLKTLGVRHGI